MKYRRLEADELAELENDFIQFLAANTITGDDWVKIKAETPEKADQLIDMFSDIVFDKVLKKVEYLEFKTPNDIKTFHCREDKIVMFGLMVAENSAIDFTQNMTAEQMSELLRLSGAQAKLYTAEKKYKGEREMELFRMMENGCLISKGDIYRSLEGLTKGQ